MSQIQKYSSALDPTEHCDYILIKGVNNNTMCQSFAHTFTCSTKFWFRSLKTSIISSLDQLFTEFVHEFCYASSQDQATLKLAFIKQVKSESLANYASRFYQEMCEPTHLVTDIPGLTLRRICYGESYGILFKSNGLFHIGKLALELCSTLSWKINVTKNDKKTKRRL